MTTNNLSLPVLKLNSRWQPIDIIDVRKAFEDACAGAVTFLKFHEGYPTPYRIEDWMKMPVNGDDYITTSRMHGLRRVAIPRVVICTTFNRIISKEQKCNPDNLHRRYGGKDAVTGKPLDRKNMSREHVRPRSKGGKSGWENEVPMDKKLNSKRGNQSYRKLGLKKPKILPAPRPLPPINTLVNRHGFPEWDLFQIPRA